MNHAFVILRQPSYDPSSITEFYFRGGPTGIGLPPRGFGCIKTEFDRYRPGSRDWTTNPSGISSIKQIENKPVFDQYYDFLATTMNKIMNQGIKYGLPSGKGCGGGANSNSTAYQGIRDLRFNPPAPPVPAPCWEVNPYRAAKCNRAVTETEGSNGVAANQTGTTAEENPLIPVT